MVKNPEFFFFFFKATTRALEVTLFRFGQILFNLARLFATHHENSFAPA